VAFTCTRWQGDETIYAVDARVLLVGHDIKDRFAAALDQAVYDRPRRARGDVLFEIDFGIDRLIW